MRHFRARKLVPLSVAVAGLTSRLEATGAEVGPVGGARSTERLASADRPAVAAEPLPAITAGAEPKLKATVLAEREPVLR